MKPIYSLLFFFMVCLTFYAQETVDSELFIQLKQSDSLVFEEGFNKCNIKILENVMHKDLQFMHDRSGMQDRNKFFELFEESICSDARVKPIRKLTKGSLSVYPLMDNGNLYGAIQMGTHEFFIAETGKKLRPSSSAKFIHTWLLENGQWKLYRVLSYDHKELKG